MSARPGVFGPLRTTLEMIKFSHTLFALPFALYAAFLAAGGWPEAATLAKILLAMVGARSAAMAHNRLADRRIDAANPRTASRALPSGVLSVGFVKVFLAASVVLFVAAAASLNRLTLLLSPVALALLLLYSYTKRFTALSHLILGLCLALAPVGAWIAVRGSVELLPVLLGLAVLFWTAGFDVIYSLQDEAFDRSAGLRSIPARLGAGRALVVSALLHVAMVVLLGAVWRLSGGGAILLAGIAATLAALVYQHAIVRPGDLSRVNAAFFTANGFVSVTLCLCGIAQVLSRMRNPLTHAYYRGHLANGLHEDSHRLPRHAGSRRGRRTAAARSDEDAAAPPKITGTVTYPRADRPAARRRPCGCGSTTRRSRRSPQAGRGDDVSTGGKQVPIPFELPYAAADIAPAAATSCAQGSCRRQDALLVEDTLPCHHPRSSHEARDPGPAGRRPARPARSRRRRAMG